MNLRSAKAAETIRTWMLVPASVVAALSTIAFGKVCGDVYHGRESWHLLLFFVPLMILPLFAWLLWMGLFGWWMTK